jgi:probable O-glycosylation ligase (exosortase A-associated)
MRDVLLIALVGGSFFISLRRPVYGVLFFVFLGVFNPQSMAWGIAWNLPLSQISAIGALLGYLVSREPRRFPDQREFRLLLLLWAIFGISTIFAINPEAALKQLILVTKILVMIVFILCIINTQERLNLLLKVISFSIGFYAVKGAIFVVLTGGDNLVYGPQGSFLAANNSIGLALAMNVPLLVYLLRIERRFWLRWVIRVMLVTSYPSVICTYSRGAWLGLAMATAFVILRSRYKYGMVAFAGLVAVALIIIAPVIAPDRLAVRYDSLVHYQEDSSAQSRLWNWEFCRRVGLSHPLTGAGFNYYAPALYETYYPEFLERFPGKLWSCHSVWLTMLSEQGMIGFVLWLVLILSALLSLRQMRTRGKKVPKLAEAADCAEMVQAAIVVYLLVGTFLDAAYFDLFYYLIGITIILKERFRVAAFESRVSRVAEQPIGSVLRNASQAKAI